MVTKRTPIARDTRRIITPAAVAAFTRWRLAPAGPEETAAYSELHDELGARPWQWPCVVNPNAGNPYPPGCYAAEQWERRLAERPEAIELWIELERLAKAAKSPAAKPKRPKG